MLLGILYTSGSHPVKTVHLGREEKPEGKKVVYYQQPRRQRPLKLPTLIAARNEQCKGKNNRWKNTSEAWVQSQVSRIRLLTKVVFWLGRCFWLLANNISTTSGAGREYWADLNVFTGTKIRIQKLYTNDECNCSWGSKKWMDTSTRTLQSCFHSNEKDQCYSEWQKRSMLLLKWQLWFFMQV